MNYSICFFRASKSSASAAPDLSSRCSVSRRCNHGLWCTALQCGVEFVPVSFPSNPHECHLMTNSRRIPLLCTVAKSHHALCRRTQHTSYTYHQTIPSFGLPYPQPCPRTMKGRSTAYNIRVPTTRSVSFGAILCAIHTHRLWSRTVVWLRPQKLSRVQD